MHLDGLVDAVALEAAALADPGVIDPDEIPCAGCGVPAVGHDEQNAGHPHKVPAAYRLAMDALAADERDAMDIVVEYRNSRHVRSGKTGPSPSDAGSCRRQLWYRDNPPDGYVPRTGIDERRAALGSMLHDDIQAAGEALFPWIRYELTVPVPGLDRDGRIDKYDPILGKVSDTKSAGRAKWDIIGADGPTPEMWAQLRIYGYALDMLGLPVRTLEIVAINRDTGAEEHFTEPYDPAAGLAALDDLIITATALDAGVEMPRDGDGPSDWRCQWCPALDHCWNTARARELGRSPRSLTLLGEEPSDPSIVWAGLELMRISAERLKLKKLEDLADELVQGIRPATYGKDRADGGVTVYNKATTSTQYKKAINDLRDRYAALYERYAAVRPADAEDDQVLPPEQLPPVPQTRGHKTGVKKPVREATRKRTPKKKTAAVEAAELVAAIVGVPEEN